MEYDKNLKYEYITKITTAYPYDAVFLSNRKLEWLQVTDLEWARDLSKDVFTATIQKYFESSSEGFIDFKVYDRRLLHFFQISNGDVWRSLF